MRFLFFGCFIFGVIGFSSCSERVQNSDVDIVRQLRMADSLITTPQIDSGFRLLKGIRRSIKKTDPAISEYYCILAQWESNPELKSSYADSALAYFAIDDRKNKLPNQYYKALLCKGEACVFLKQYNTALKYYYRARQILNNGNCQDGYLSVKMAGIYYKQKNYRLAAKLWSSSYNLILQCGDENAFQKQFYTLQGVLNNSGISYQRIGMLDSARYFYLKDLELIGRAEASGIDVSSARVVVYDNLGGLALTGNDLPAARRYLLKSVGMPLTERDGIKIPPYIKLADLYTRTGETAKARNAFEQSKQRLALYTVQNLDQAVLWNKLYAQFLFKQGQVVQAYNYQNAYMSLKDSVDDVSVNLYRLDVNRELNSLAQTKELSQLTQKNSTRKIYLVGSILIALLACAIMILVYRNLKRSRSLHRITVLQNQQLEQALAELERVNQNYIRIMRVMAHDLRNPISGMTGLAAILLGEDEFSGESKHMLKLIETTGIHTMEMINELLKSGLADENEAMDVELIDLKSLLFDSVELLQFKADEKRQRIIFESDDTPVMGRVNHEKIWRVFNNLIVNAIKFSHPDTVIDVGITYITYDEKRILISITDNGIGIAEEDKHKIFEMFTPAKRVGTNGEQPFGLGLSISKRIIEKHNGKIWFESTPHEGTTFYIELPCAE